MIFRPTRLLLLFLLFLLSPVVFSAKTAATSFCKCICFNNSTIIALNPPTTSTSASTLRRLDVRAPEDHLHDRSSNFAVKSGLADREERQHHKLTCADCTRAFCLDYNLPICKNAREEDVFTTCFQRDSLKDETVVVIFIFATAGLLAWAVVKPWVDRLRDRDRTTSAPLGQRDQSSPGSGSGLGGRMSSRGGKGKAQARAQNHGRVAGGYALVDTAGGSAPASASRREDDGEDGGDTFTVGTYDEDVHADHHAVDIVSHTPLGSGLTSHL